MTYRGEGLRARVAAATSVAAILTIGGLMACLEPSSAPSSPAGTPTASANREAADVADQVGKLRAVTARFHDIEVARDAGYTIELTGCYKDEMGGRGAMGYHFGKGSALDATVDQLEPEALLYEPQKNGRPRLVGVEFIVPFTAVPASSTPPRAFGLDFKQNFVFNVWALHVWVWKNNPSGIFADWNPDVTCDFAPAATNRVSHSH
jgi:hypothetical protein